VEAIEAMGISPLRFLVAPRIVALFALMPCLAVVSSVAAIIATSLISRAYFNIAWVYFTDLVLNALLIRDIVTGLVKSFLFGFLIAAIACFRGLNVRGGAAGVGIATTSSVVTAITAVIAFDTVFNIVYVVFFP
jgi:phospholipid/cholesterol/gamma-HCH transport system permease protein